MSNSATEKRSVTLKAYIVRFATRTSLKKELQSTARAMQVLLLAGPGVVIGTALTAVFVKYVFPYNWTWLESLLFGAMLSATDPVAVIALLQEVCETSSCVCIHGCYLSCW
jgi:NhaP-type Na+/H+ or K+/H+ antiporter